MPLVDFTNALVVKSKIAFSMIEIIYVAKFFAFVTNTNLSKFFLAFCSGFFLNSVIFD